MSHEVGGVLPRTRGSNRTCHPTPPSLVPATPPPGHLYLPGCHPSPSTPPILPSFTRTHTDTHLSPTFPTHTPYIYLAPPPCLPAEAWLGNRAVCGHQRGWLQLQHMLLPIQRGCDPHGGRPGCGTGLWPGPPGPAIPVPGHAEGCGCVTNWGGGRSVRD